MVPREKKVTYLTLLPELKTFSSRKNAYKTKNSKSSICNMLFESHCIEDQGMTENSYKLNFRVVTFLLFLFSFIIIWWELHIPLTSK